MCSSTRSALHLVSLAVLACSSPALAVSPAQDLKLTFTDTALGGYTMPYNLFLPAGYDPTGPALPVILYLHGAGERGSDNNAQINTNMQPLINTTQGSTGPYRAIVIAPQCPVGQVWNSINTGDNWNPGYINQISSYTETPAQQAARPISSALQAAMDILDSVQGSYKVNSNRLYITGLSMGGFGTWDAITRFPGKFAAAMPLSGGGNTLAAQNLVNEPIWAYHGTDDGVVHANGSSDMISAIRAEGGTEALYTLVDGVGHWGWNQFYTPYSATPPDGAAARSYYVGDTYTTGGMPAYGGENVAEWLFAQSVPEPGCVSVIILGAAGLLRRRSRHA